MHGGSSQHCCSYSGSRSRRNAQPCPLSACECKLCCPLVPVTRTNVESVRYSHAKQTILCWYVFSVVYHWMIFKFSLYNPRSAIHRLLIFVFSTTQLRVVFSSLPNLFERALHACSKEQVGIYLTLFYNKNLICHRSTLYTHILTFAIKCMVNWISMDLGYRMVWLKQRKITHWWQHPLRRPACGISAVIHTFRYYNYDGWDVKLAHALKYLP